MYHTILFDLDGTLTDPGEGITNSVAYALQKFGVPVPEREALYRFIGPPLHESFERFYGFSPEKAMQAVAYYREYYREKGIFENKLCSGIPDLLQQLTNSGKTCVLATSKPTMFAVQILEYFKIDKHFSHVAGANMDGSRTDKGEVIAHALHLCNITEVSGVIMVGDREHDVIGARAHGIPCIGVLYGYGDEAELLAAGAAHIADNAEEIAGILLNEK